MIPRRTAVLGRNAEVYAPLVLVYRVHDTAGDDLGTILHAAANVEPGDVIFLTDGLEALVTARVETPTGTPFAALLEVAVAPTPLTNDDGIA